MQDFVLQTKLHPPQLKGKILRRARLLNLLKENLDKKLILICADAGYGKTTLLAQLLNDIDNTCIYYTLTQADSNPVVFFNHLIFGFQKYYSNFGERIKSILDDSLNFIANAERVLNTFINDVLVLKKCIIILDDFHTITQAVWTKSAFDYLLTYLPSNVHFIIASREIPDFNLSRLLARQDLFMLTKEDLKFTDDEVRELLTEILSVDISEEQIKRLLDVSQGWITGIQLILPRYPDEDKIKEALNGFLTANQPLFDYFANEIFVNEEEWIQRFLMAISTLDEIYPEYCDAIMNINNSLCILKELENRNIFLSSIGKEKNHFQFHPLFRNFLKSQLESRSGVSKISSIYRKVARFCEKHSRFDEAIEYYIRSLSYDRAARLIERRAEQIIGKGDVMSLRNWLFRMPQYLFIKHPWLNYYKNFLLDRIDNRLDEALRGYQQTRRLFKKKNIIKGIIKATLNIATILCRRGFVLKAKREIQKVERDYQITDKSVLFFSYNIKAMIAECEGNYEKVEKYLHNMLKLAEMLKNPRYLILTHCNLGVHYADMGDFNSAEKEYEAALKVRIKEQYQRGLGNLYANAAYIKILKGKYDEARELLKEGLDFAIKYNANEDLAFVRLTLGDLYTYSGNFQKASDEYKKALAYAIESKEKVYLFNTLESLCALFLKKGDILGALEYYRMATQDESWKYFSSRPTLVLLKNEISIAQGEYKSAIRSLKRLLVIVKNRKLYYAGFVTNLLLALVYEKLQKNYLPYLIQALNLCRRYGYEQVFMEDKRFKELLIKSKMFETDDYVKGILSKPERMAPEIKEKYLIKIKVNLFGTPEVFADGKFITNWISDKAKKLFCYFVVNRERKITRDEIIEHFWRDWEPDKAENNLSSTLYYIRKILLPERKKYRKEIILYREHSYYLDPELIINVDVTEFNSIFQEIKIKKSVEKSVDGELLKKALSLYKRDFCACWYDPWVENQRTVYRNRFLQLLLWAIEDAFTQKDYKGCIEYCRKAMKIDPYDEEIVAFLIRSLVKIGRTSEAFTSFNQFVDTLREIGISPSSKFLECQKELK